MNAQVLPYQQPNPRSVRLSKIARLIFDIIASQWFFIVLAIFIVLARFFPNFARHGGIIRAEYSIGYGAVAAIFLISGLSLNTKDFMKNLSNWRAHSTVLTFSFLITSSIVYGILTGIKKRYNPNIDEWMLVGLIVTACCPTTVASNVMMTQKASGNDLLTLSEVFIGNILGGFITPALVQLYFGKSSPWAFANPASGSYQTVDIYKSVMKSIGLSVFLPLFVGQVIRNIFPAKVIWFHKTFKLSKVSNFLLILIMFSSFSTAFYQHSFTSVPAASIIFTAFFCAGIYLFFTAICFAYSRPTWLLTLFPQTNEQGLDRRPRVYRFLYKSLRPFYYSRKDTVAVMLCGPAKTASLGVSLVTAQYGSQNPNLGKLLIPLVLYQSEQVLMAGLLVFFMKRWIENDPDLVESDPGTPAETAEAGDSTWIEQLSQLPIRPLKKAHATDGVPV
ncbi:unnamed protein product [Kuraishia capsulata CBS 1993]|uniref:Uncharacterized protein n=1 Tax=Kuraishia capsulata CBS 1993 TaxID=1382522 RepID=W6MSL5_9ASCO|nr:uncharacterized protein KUCA_T00000746001 [Kuraishia capsulata CBS 1993]CDK24780.1 unnamed protein product [Kuraishia capsulata CBS 1993]